MRAYVVDDSQAGQRLDKYLGRILPGAPYSLLRKFLRKKTVKLNGTRAEGRELLKAGDEIQVFLSDASLEELSVKKERTSFEEFCDQSRRALDLIGSQLGPDAILYEDEDVLIVDKPFGVLSQKSTDADISMNEWLLACLWDRAGGMTEGGQRFYESLQGFRPSVCNRLDRNTGGLLLCGKTLRGSRALTEMLRERTLHKYYLAVAEGQMRGQGTLRDRLQRDRTAGVTAVSDQGAEACTRYRVLRTGTDCSLIEAELITGKTHQIRAQFAAAGHPLVGDPKYGRRRPGSRLPGQYLYCYRLVFPDSPETAPSLSPALRGREIRTEAPAAFYRAVNGGHIHK